MRWSERWREHQSFWSPHDKSSEMVVCIALEWRMLLISMGFSHNVYALPLDSLHECWRPLRLLSHLHCLCLIVEYFMTIYGTERGSHHVIGWRIDDVDADEPVNINMNFHEIKTSALTWHDCSSVTVCDLTEPVLGELWILISHAVWAFEALCISLYLHCSQSSPNSIKSPA